MRKSDASGRSRGNRRSRRSNEWLRDRSVSHEREQGGRSAVRVAVALGRRMRRRASSPRPVGRAVGCEPLCNLHQDRPQDVEAARADDFFRSRSSSCSLGSAGREGSELKLSEVGRIRRFRDAAPDLRNPHVYCSGLRHLSIGTASPASATPRGRRRRFRDRQVESSRVGPALVERLPYRRWRLLAVGSARCRHSIPSHSMLPFGPIPERDPARSEA